MLSLSLCFFKHAIEQGLQGRVVSASTQPCKHTCQHHLLHLSMSAYVCCLRGSYILFVHRFYIEHAVADILRVQGLTPDTLKQNIGLATVCRCHRQLDHTGLGHITSHPHSLQG